MNFVYNFVDINFEFMVNKKWEKNDVFFDCKFHIFNLIKEK